MHVGLDWLALAASTVSKRYQAYRVGVVPGNAKLEALGPNNKPMEGLVSKKFCGAAEQV